MFDLATKFSYIGTYVPTYYNIVQSTKLTGDPNQDKVILLNLKEKAK
jgi:hypothetical protein